MKRNFILLLLMLGLSIGLFAQKTVVVTGNFDSPLSGKKVWVKYYGGFLNCYFPDSTLTNSAGHYELIFTIDTSCFNGAIFIESLDCLGDTIYHQTPYYNPTWHTDTIFADMEYCDTCRYLEANFSPTIQSQYTHFNNTTIPGQLQNKYTWDFGDGSAYTHTGNTDHNYAALGSYTACLQVEDSIRGCRDTVCKTINITKKNRPDSIFIKGHVNQPINSTAWLDFAGYPSGCSVNTTLGVTAGTFNYAIPTASCYFGIITVKMLDCNGDTLVYNEQYDTLRVSDTFTVNFTYCDSCKNFNADFNYIASGDTVAFINISDSSANSFEWSFNYNDPSQSSTLKNPTHIYGVLSTYSIKLTARDTIKGCLDSVRKWITLTGGGTPQITLSGIVFSDSAVLADTFVVWLINVQIDSIANDTLLTAVDSLMGPNGYYTFTNVNSGVYLVKAALLPASSNYANRMPTYYNSTTQWRTATPVVVSSSVYNVNINLISGSNPGGSGFISGYVSVGANKTGDPLEKIQVMLYNAMGNAVSYTYTEENR
jgi:PKD repeat protein